MFLESHLEELEAETLNVLILGTGYPRFREDFSNVYLHRLAVSLVKIGVKVQVVAPHADGLRKEEVMDGVHIHRFQYMQPEKLQTLAYFPGIPENIKIPFNKMQAIPFAVSMAKKMLQIIKRFEIDVVNAHWAFPPAFLSILTKPLHRRPILTTLYGVELFTARNKYAGLKRILSWTIINSDRVVAISDATRNSAVEISARSNIEVVPYGVDMEQFSTESDGAAIRRRYDLNGHVILFCGRLVERKGVEYLIRAMPSVIANIPDTSLLVVGEGPEKSRLMRLAVSLGVRDRITFAGSVSNEDLPKFYAACDVFVLPAIIDVYGDTEGFGIVLVEAMASGKPVIGTRVGGISSWFDENEAYGFLIEQKDQINLSKKIVTLLNDDNMRKEFGRNARRVAESRFSFSKIAEMYLKTFRELT